MVHLTGQVERFLRAQRVARLATVDAQGRPHVVPIVFAYAAGRLYTPLDLKPKSVSPRRLGRVRNILANPQVQVLVDHYTDDWQQLGYVQLRGRAELIERGYEYRRALRLLERRYPQYAQLPLQGRPIIKVSVERVFSWGRLPRTASSESRASRFVTVDEVKRASTGERVSLRAQVLRTWLEGGVHSALVGDSTGLTRVETGRRRVGEGISYSFRNGLVREYEGGWRSVALDGASRMRQLRRSVPVSAGPEYVERVAKILRTMARKRGR